MIVSPYAAVLALVFVVLSVRTLRLRRKLRIAVGDGGNAEMLRAMRVHANFSEYAPLSLLILILFETKGAHPALVHSACVALTVGRLLHAYGVSRVNENFLYRVSGMALTLTTLILTSAYILIVSLFS